MKSSRFMEGISDVEEMLEERFARAGHLIHERGGAISREYRRQFTVKNSLMRVILPSVFMMEAVEGQLEKVGFKARGSFGKETLVMLPIYVLNVLTGRLAPAILHEVPEIKNMARHVVSDIGAAYHHGTARWDHAHAMGGH